MSTITASTTPRTGAHEFTGTLPGRLLLGLSATLVVAVAAHVAIPLPFTPVPLTLQPLAVLGVGLALGPLDGFLVMLAYLAEGALGMPVFAPTGLGGVAQMLGPTGGYLMSYPLVAAVAGSLTQTLHSRMRRFPAALIGCAVATLLLMVCGAGWIALQLHLSAQATWIAAVAPFLPGEIIKLFVAAGIYSTLSKAKSY